MGWRRYEYDYDYDDEDDDSYFDQDCDAHETPPDAVILNGPLYAENKRGEFGATWWGKKWIAAVDSFYQDNRLSRGRSYARNGSTQRLEISYGSAYAPVQGSRRKPYCVEINLNPFQADEWAEALDALSSQAIYAAKLLAGEMPSDIEDVFQRVDLSLFPRNLSDINFECSCPDYGDPCKHAAAVYYLLSEQIDADPFVLFHLRGRTREQVLGTLRALRGVAPSDADSESAPEPDVRTEALELENFWTGEAEVVIQHSPTIPKQPPLLRQLGDPPGNIVADLKSIYKAISAEASRWLGL
jgi:uncharacterized Zn finger protein